MNVDDNCQVHMNYYICVTDPVPVPHGKETEGNLLSRREGIVWLLEKWTM